MGFLSGKKIVLGITGSIAAYKACLIARGLIKRGAEVQVVMTPSGKEFITPLTLSTLTRKPVISDFFSRRDGTWHSHVDIGLWADAMLIAPCTASTLGKMACGIADNMLITTYMSMKAPVFAAPAMDLDMYANPATQDNIRKLSSYGVRFIEPESGFLASGLEGKGRMAEPETVIEALEAFFAPNAKELAGKKILVTAGPTYEKIDPVRFIGNYSSGKMGFAIAEECARRGADVVLVAGPVSIGCSPAIRRIDVESSDEMYEAATAEYASSDAAILAAAVADYKPENAAKQKIKHDEGGLTLRLQSTHDIAAALGAMKKHSQKLVVFALETDHEEENAAAKLRRKNADFIVLNSLRNEGTCFQTDDNKIVIMDGEHKTVFPKKSKKDVAKDIVDELCRVLITN